MLQGFKDAGFEVFEIIGDSRSRKLAMDEAKRMVSRGEKFDFVYSESETMPTALTDPDHLPRHPLMDFAFLKFCRDHSIPVGLFYRDAYWRSSEYRNAAKGLKRIILDALYRYDLLQYRQKVDVLFIPSLEFAPLVMPEMNGVRFEVLPSGCNLINGVTQKEQALDGSIGEALHLLYVGGISVGEAYDLSMLVEAVRDLPNTRMTMCVRESDWLKVKEHYSGILGNNIEVVHLSGKDLRPLYEEADIGIMFFAPSPYRSICMPTKLFEYLGEGLPILALSDTSSGNYVQTHGIGVCADYSRDSLEDCIVKLRDDRSLIWGMRQNCLSCRESNTWRDRAMCVADTLCDSRGSVPNVGVDA